MERTLVLGTLLLAALARHATAQVIPPPVTATVITFEDVPAATDISQIPGPLTTEYVSRGITFGGFGRNGGTVVGFGQGTTSGANVLVMFGIYGMLNGGTALTPDFLDFYPPITYLQFNASTFDGFDCQGTMIMTVEGFAPNGASLGSVVSPLPVFPITFTYTYPPPGAARVVINTTRTCGFGAFEGIEVFSIDDIAFIPTVPASRCGQSQLDAAGKKAKAVSACYAKALQNGVDVDGTCLQKAADTFTKAFTKAQGLGDCPTDTDAATLESAVDSLIASAVGSVTGGSPGPDICFGKKLSAIGKKAQSVLKCSSKGAKTGTATDDACVEKAGASFDSSLKKCGTPAQLAPVEQLIDEAVISLSRTVNVPTTTTTTTTTSTTSTTLAPPLGPHLTFTTTPGSDCVGGGPFSGEVDADTAGTMKLADLGLGCLLIGAGNGLIPATLIPENASSILESFDGGATLVASFGTGPRDCTKGPAATRHCLNSSSTECTSDADCSAFPGACVADANCFFGPPIPVNGFPKTCVVNTFATDASGTVNVDSGDSSVSINLASRVYLSFNTPTACPQCIGGLCTFGQNPDGPCETTNVNQTTLDCPPGEGTFLATLPVDLTPLTTSDNVVTAPDGLFCSGQLNPGAFGQDTAQRIEQVGMPGGDLSDGLPHPSILVSNFCIPPTGNPAVDNIADLPGPGSLSLPGMAQFSSPSGAFVVD